MTRQLNSIRVALVSVRASGPMGQYGEKACPGEVIISQGGESLCVSLCLMPERRTQSGRYSEVAIIQLVTLPLTLSCSAASPGVNYKASAKAPNEPRPTEYKLSGYPLEGDEEMSLG